MKKIYYIGSIIFAFILLISCIFLNTINNKNLLLIKSKKSELQHVKEINKKIVEEEKKISKLEYEENMYNNLIKEKNDLESNLNTISGEIKTIESENEYLNYLISNYL